MSGSNRRKADAIRQFGVLLVLIRSSLITILTLADVLEEVRSDLFLTQVEASIFETPDLSRVTLA